MGTLSGPLAEILRGGRHQFNLKFAAAAKGGGIDRMGFLQHLGGTVDPIIRAVAGIYPERTSAVVNELYDLSLQLFAIPMLGPECQYPEIGIIWREVLPRIPKILAIEPTKVAGALSNAMYSICATEGTHTQGWINAMRDISSLCLNTEALMQCGVVSAWRCGMSHYRQCSCAAALRLPSNLAAAALGLPRVVGAEEINLCVQAIMANPWMTPTEHTEKGAAPNVLQILAQRGKFRGFSGLFPEPPRVRCNGEQLLVSSGRRHWRIEADAFNVVFVPIGDAIGTNTALVNEDGTVLWSGQNQRFPELVRAASAAATRNTLAVTLRDSFHVFMLGLAPPGRRMG